MVYNKQARLDNKLYRVWEAQMYRGRNNEDDHLISVDEATTLSLKLLADGANPLVSMGGDSILHYWAGNGPLVCLEAALKMVDRKDLNRLNERYEGERATPIENAVGRNRMDCAKALIEAGAKVGHGSTYRGDPILFQLAQHRMGGECIRAAIKMNPECVDSCNDQGKTPLMIATRVCATECMKVLIDGGASVNWEAKEETTALMVAGWLGEPELVKTLIGVGADLDLQDRVGQTALMGAAASGSAEAVNALVVAGAGLEVLDSEGRTALMWAATRGNPDTVNALVVAGANLDLQDYGGRTVEGVLHTSEAGEEDTKACLELIQAAKAGQRAAALDRKLDQACDSWSPPSASSKQATRGHQSISDKQGQAQQEMPAPRSRQRF